MGMRIVPPVAGLLFGAGLALSGMTNPVRVQAFLDVAGPWDPTLGFVMGGALAVTIVGPLVLQRAGFGVARPTGPQAPIDGRLVIGSALFGVGWGAAGFCPGPALADLASGDVRVALFVGAMVAGMLLYRLVIAFVDASTRATPAKWAREDG